MDILSIKNLSKTFPGVQALKDVNLSVKKGSIHALMGENGAGKSTLIKILYGVHRPDPGAVIEVDGKAFIASSPLEALAAGIAIVPQEISPVPNISLTANLYLGREIYRGAFLDNAAMEKETRNILNELELDELQGCEGKLMRELTIAQAQLLSLVSAITQKAKIIVLDEPTTALTEQEVKSLFKIVRRFNARGVTFIYITHKLDEVFEIADGVSVLRDGSYIGYKAIQEITRDQMISMMIGRKVDDFFMKEDYSRTEKLFEVEDLSSAGRFSHISFDVCRGEVFGIAGLVGSGRSELLESLFGYIPADSGTIKLGGKKITMDKPQAAITNKMGFITEDRKLTGLFFNLSVSDNVIMADCQAFLAHGLFDEKSIQTAVAEQRDNLLLKTTSLHALVSTLSGGNQQKVLLARWLLLQPEVLLLDEPTKGIDVGAKHEIYLIIERLAKMGKSVIMVSSDMLELLSLSDRIMVLHQGRCSGVIEAGKATQEQVLRLATGETLLTH